ncbi:reverse transcriptase domain-containing protein [Tanacetum coccineum]
MYLAASEESISAVLMAERGKKQVPVYFAIELGDHEIEFRGRNSVKGQILANFLAETPSKKEEGAKDEEAKIKEPELEKAWKLFTDGALSSDGSGADSQLVDNQVNGLFEARQTIIKQYLEKAKELLANFPCHSIEHIKRDQNKKADALSKLASMTFSKLAKEVLVEVIQDKSITQREVADVTQEKEDSWMIPIREYLQWGKLPDDPQKEKHRPKASSKKYIKVHAECTQRCETCQIHSLIPKKPKQEMTSIMSAWPFSQWGINIIGPLPIAPGGARFLVVAIDYFIKWVEAKPLTSTTGKHIERFMWEHINNSKVQQRRNSLQLSLRFQSRDPIEISIETRRIQDFDPKQNEKRRREDLDILKERREIASIKEAHYKQKLEGYYNKRVRPSTFKPGTYVLRLNSASKAEF